MRKSGLQKQISSIFNGTPASASAVSSAALSTQDETIEAADDQASSVSTPDSDAAPQALPSLAQRMAALQTEAVHTPAAPAMRPKPLIRTVVTSAKPKVNAEVGVQIKKALFGGKADKLDPRQKKMTMMVGVLSVVFAGVLFISLGGLGQSGSSTVNQNEMPELTASVQPDTHVLQWYSPQPIPEQMRNPMEVAKRENPVQSQSVDAAGRPVGQVVVKGIVFSKTRPTAIINDQIVAAGEVVNGVTVEGISKEQVAFSKDGKRWTQTVQR